MKTIFNIIIALFILTVFVTGSYSQKIDGWFKAGSKPEAYEWGKADEKYNDGAVYFLKSKEPAIDGFGTIMTYIMPEKYSGKRIRLTGYVKNESLTGWAGMWMRVDGTNKNKSLAFDNMSKRAIAGTNDWTKYEIVLDVAPEAIGIAYGFLVHGIGSAWFSGFSIETVGSDVPTTDMTK
jgi:hypothetical protein